MSNRRLICGWGINDNPTPVSWYEIKEGDKVRVTCPIYTDWTDMICRAKSDKEKARHPTYTEVYVDARFQKFTDFKHWVVNVQPNKDWINCDLDKDLLSLEVKIYSPDTAVYLDSKVNRLLTNSAASRGNYLMGVYFEESTRKFRACCQNPFNGKNDKLGRFMTEGEAHKAWQAKKHEHACRLADLQEDPRVADALRQRYAPDKDWTKA